MRPFFQPLAEYQRIARNRPHPNIDKAYPKTTDGTTASIIAKTPRRIIQQLPTGKIVSDSQDESALLAEFIYTHRIIPNANSQHALIAKCWLAVKQALTNGAAVGYVPFVKNGDYIGTDLLIPNIKDVWLEKGKISDTDSNVICMRGWYQPSDIDAIINKERKLQKKAEDRGDAYEAGWDLTALAKIKDELKTKDARDSFTPEKEKAATGIEIIHVFQRGVKGKFYSVHVDTKQVVRTVENKDPRGEIPIHYLYADIDGSNPLGNGFVEMVGSLQNLMDAEMQMYQYNRALMLNPPIIKRGNYAASQLKLAPNSIWNLGSDPNNSAEMAKIDSTAIANFPALYGLTKSQLLNLLSSPDTSISSEVGNPGFSKTDAGVKSQQATMSVDDNYIRKNFETWFERVSETQINRYFAERIGKETIQLDDDYAAKIKQVDESLVNDKNEIKVDWSDETKALKFEVDASTSNMKDDAAERDRLVELLDLSQKYPQLDKRQGGPIDCIELVDRIVVKSGVEDPEKIVPKQEEGEGGVPEQQEQPQVTPEMVQQLVQQTVQEAMASQEDNHKKEQNALKAREIDLKEQDLQLKAVAQAHKDASQHASDLNPETNDPAPEPTEPLAEAPALTEEDQAFAQQIVDLGYTDEQAGQALAMDKYGMSIDEIVKVLEATNG